MLWFLCCVCVLVFVCVCRLVTAVTENQNRFCTLSWLSVQLESRTQRRREREELHVLGVVGLTGWLHMRPLLIIRGDAGLHTCYRKFAFQTRSFQQRQRNLRKAFHALLLSGGNSAGRPTCLDCVMRRRRAGVIFV